MMNHTEISPQKPAEESVNLPITGPDDKSGLSAKAGSAILANQNGVDLTVPIELSRQELLNAIDFEISQRESLNSKHGINVWGIIGAVVALLWTSLNEITSTGHNWTNTILAFFVSWWILVQVVSLFTKKLGWSGTIQPSSGKAKTIYQVFLLTGVHPETVPYYICEIALLLCLSAYLGAKGFIFLSVVACAFYGFLILLMIFVLIMMKVQIPIELITSAEKQNPRQWIVFACVWGFVIGVLCLALGTFAKAWPNIAKEDIHLGCILAALGAVISFSIKFTRPPIGLGEFRSLRSRVAFGLIDIPTARKEAESILFGPARQNYLTLKADAVIAVLNDRQKAAIALVARMNRIIALADELKEKPRDSKILDEANLEKRLAFGRFKSGIAAMDKHLKEAVKVRSELTLRSKIARTLLKMSASEVEAVLNRVDAAGKSSDSAAGQIRERFDRFMAALKNLEPALKDYNGDKGQLLTLREMVKGLFLK